MRNIVWYVCFGAGLSLCAAPTAGDVVRDYSCAGFGTGCNNLIPSGAPNIAFGTMSPSVIMVPDLGAGATLVDVNISIRLTHTWRGDLSVYLSVAGSPLQELFSNLGSSMNNANDIDVTLDDEAASQIIAGPCASAMACVGTFRPETLPLSNFEGGNPSGDWTLFITDGGGNDYGALQAWSVRLTLADDDADGVQDGEDNCISTANPDQADGDGDDIGDVCDVCPALSSADQDDPDSDGVGDECDSCPNSSNADQADPDNDGRGSACDNCPSAANFDQADTDGDEYGDVCDSNPTVFNPDDQGGGPGPGPGPGTGAACGTCAAGTPLPMLVSIAILPILRRRRR